MRKLLVWRLAARYEVDEASRRTFKKWGLSEDPDDYHELPPMTLEEFTQLDHWTGGNDLSYDHWCRENNYRHVDSFNDEILRRYGKILLVPGEPTFSITGDPDFDQDDPEYVVPLHFPPGNDDRPKTFTSTLPKELRDKMFRDMIRNSYGEGHSPEFIAAECGMEVLKVEEIIMDPDDELRVELHPLRKITIEDGAITSIETMEDNDGDR